MEPPIRSWCRVEEVAGRFPLGPHQLPRLGRSLHRGRRLLRRGVRRYRLTRGGASQFGAEDLRRLRFKPQQVRVTVAVAVRDVRDQFVRGGGIDHGEMKRDLRRAVCAGGIDLEPVLELPEQARVAPCYLVPGLGRPDLCFLPTELVIARGNTVERHEHEPLGSLNSLSTALETAQPLEWPTM